MSFAIEKKWTLQRRIVDGETLALDTCEVDRQLIFNYTSNTSDNNSLWYVNKVATCATETDTLKGYWFIPSPGSSSLLPTDTVAFVWESASPEFFEVNTITQGQLEIESLSSGTDLVERFGN